MFYKSGWRSIIYTLKWWAFLYLPSQEGTDSVAFSGRIRGVSIVAQTYEPAVILCPAQPTSAFSLHARPLYPPREDRFIAPFQGNLQSPHNGLPYQPQRHPALDAGSSNHNNAGRSFTKSPLERGRILKRSAEESGVCS